MLQKYNVIHDIRLYIICIKQVPVLSKQVLFFMQNLLAKDMCFSNTDLLNTMK